MFLDVEEEFRKKGVENVILLDQHHRKLPVHASVTETELLIQSSGGKVVSVLTALRDKPEAGMFMGMGKLEELKQLVEQTGADLVLINHPISPSQERNIEGYVKARVLDRTGLILDIFAQRASSHEGKLQVELAQLKHLSTRLVRGWTHLERQKGGIGLRGPGETQLETDRQLIGHRIKLLTKRLQQVSKQRGLRRRGRKKVPVPIVSLVGYTNAGKSTLFNRMTGEDVYAADQLFATLDTTMRRLHIKSLGDVVFSDTVGFIQNLPHSLVAAFHSTLEEVIEASLLLHVVDSADDDKDLAMSEVDNVLSEIGADEVPSITIYNKIDASGMSAGIQRDENGKATEVYVSALTGEGIELINEAIYSHLGIDHQTIEVTLPPSQGQLHAELHTRAQVMQESVDEEGQWLMCVSLNQAQFGWFAKQSQFLSTYLQSEVIFDLDES